MYRLYPVFHDVCNALIQIFAFIILFLTPISNYVHLVLVLVALDLITGSWASIKEGQKFNAHKLRNTVEKFIFYAIAIIIAYVLQKIINDGTELARIVALYIGSIEVKSNYENISRIRQVDLIHAIWNLIKDKIEEYISGLKAKNNQPKT